MTRGDRDVDLLVVAAQPEEVAGLLARHRPLRRWRAGPARAVDLRLGGARLAVAVTGEGRVRAEAGLTAVLDHMAPARALAIGLAGALSPGLAVGALVAAERVRLEGESPTRLAVWGDSEPDLAVADLVTVDRIVARPEERAELLAAVGGTGPAAVDMELGFYARIAASRGIPLAAVKSISDASDEVLPAFLARARRADGSLDRRRIALAALLRRGALADLLDLRRRARSASTALAAVVERHAGRGAAARFG